MPDFKKLVTVFLILAAMAASSAFALSGIMSNSAPASQNDTARVSAGDGVSAPAVSANAFVEPLANVDALSAAPTASAGTANSDLPPLTPTSNLTNDASQILAHELVAANPTGPQDAGDGQNQMLAAPTVASVANNLFKNPSFKNIKIPDWDAEANALPISVIGNSQSSDTAAYAMNMSKVMSVYLASADANNIQSTNDAAPLAGTIGDTVQALESVPVPQPLVAFHKALLKLLTYEKNDLNLLANSNDDPLKNAMIAQAEEAKYNLAIKNLTNEAKKAEGGMLSDAGAKNPGGLAEAINYILGVQTAHAQFGFGGIVFDPITEAETTATVAQMILNVVNSILLQILKNLIINNFQTAVVSWIQGGGKPSFVLNWKNLFSNALNQGAGYAISQIVPGLCSPFQNLIQLQLNSYYSGLAYPTNTCTLQQVVGNIQSFYNNFSNGGWLAYGASGIPSNNYYGSLFIASQIVGQKGNEAQNGIKGRSGAGQGFSGQYLCSNGSAPYQGVICPDGNEPQPTTPGAAVANSLFTGLGAPESLIVNATDITGILASFTTSVINALVTKGTGLLGAYVKGI
ncbi:MAG TPA: hypothetical protein VNG29_01125 [Candidatus Paceibacterota bacterium]|nr:hypothetical protein [Candidatus Paceibacterota bacterium]